MTDERYQGIVPLEGESLAEAAQSYFAQSEQIPSLVRLAAEKRDGRWFAGGLLFQHLPEGEEGRERIHTRLDHPDWPHVAILAGSVKTEELTDPELAARRPRSGACSTRKRRCARCTPVRLSRGCRCDPDYVRSVIARFPAEERQAMVGDDGLIRSIAPFARPVSRSRSKTCPDRRLDVSLALICYVLNRHDEPRLRATVRIARSSGAAACAGRCRAPRRAVADEPAACGKSSGAAGPESPSACASRTPLCSRSSSIAGFNCTRVVIRDQRTSAEVHYTCAGGGFGQTTIGMLTPRSLRIETQGISDNAPFHYVLQARRVGNC